MTNKALKFAALAGLLASSASAQAPVTPGWSAFTGCWEPVVVKGQAAETDARVCVIPAGPNSVELLTLKENKVTERSRMDADGRRHDVTRQGCTGWESASFSSDGRRLYLTSEQQCSNGLERKASGIFAIAPTGEWLNVVNVSAAGGEGLRVARYKTVPATSDLPADVFAVLDRQALSDRTARVAAQSRVTTDGIIEASKYLTSGAIGAWIAELDQTFDLNEKTLVRLADNGVDPAVIDVMVAASNPKVFAVNATGSGVTLTDSTTPPKIDRTNCLTPVMDPWGYYDYNPCDPYRRYGYYGSRRYGYGYNPYYGYGVYDPYGYGGYGGYGYSNPVVIIVKGSESDPNATHGRMTKDGYRSGSSSSGSSTSSSSGSSTSSSSGSSSGSTSSSSGSSSGSSSSSGRTATKKPPVN